MYIRVYVCIYAFMHIPIDLCRYSCIYVCMDVNIHLCIYICTYVCIHLYMYFFCTYVFMYVCMFAFVCLGEGKNGILASQSHDVIGNFANQKEHVNLDHHYCNLDQRSQFLTIGSNMKQILAIE